MTFVQANDQADPNDRDEQTAGADYHAVSEPIAEITGYDESDDFDCTSWCAVQQRLLSSEAERFDKEGKEIAQMLSVGFYSLMFDR